LNIKPDKPDIIIATPEQAAALTTPQHDGGLGEEIIRALASLPEGETLEEISASNNVSVCCGSGRCSHGAHLMLGERRIEVTTLEVERGEHYTHRRRTYQSARDASGKTGLILVADSYWTHNDMFTGARL
jgi:hypothetical protein